MVAPTITQKNSPPPAVASPSVPLVGHTTIVTRHPATVYQ